MLRQDFAIFRGQTLKGVRIEVGVSLLFLACVMIHMIGGAAAFLHDLAVFCLLLCSLHLREMARAWIVELQGLKLEGIVLSGSGGYTIHERGSDRQEELIAAIGPLTSFALWALANLALAAGPDGEFARWLEIFAFINLFIAIFTSLPVQPLDGGRFFHLWLRRVLSPAFANRVMGLFGVMLSAVWLPATLLSFLIFGMILIALPSVKEHWEMLKGGDAIRD